MRLTDQQRQIIREEVARIFGPRARVYLFGSRLDDRARGGDVDLFIEVDEVLENRASAASRVAARLQQALGDQRIDVVLVDAATRKQPIHEAARREGRAL